MSEKVKQLEYLCGVSEAKPKVFQDIDDSLNDVNLLIHEKFTEALTLVNLSFERNTALVRQMQETESSVNSL